MPIMCGFDILCQNTNVNLLLAPEEMSGDHPSQKYSSIDICLKFPVKQSKSW